MRDILRQLVEWTDADRAFALAVIVGTSGSAPNLVGTAMAVADDGVIVGGISGGCVEASILDTAAEVLASGESRRRAFSAADPADPFSVGLTCGGTMDVIVTHSAGLAAQLAVLTSAVASRRRALLLTVVAGDRAVVGAQSAWDGCLDGSAAVARPIFDAVIADLPTDTGLVTVAGDTGEATVFVHCFAPPPLLIVCGAIDGARPLAAVGKLLGYRVVLCDARAAFATRARFPDVDDVIVDWPHRYLDRITVDRTTVLCVLTHDLKFSVPLLVKALELPFGYIGAMGSRATCAEQERQLRAHGVSSEALRRLRAPIGLDLGGRTPAETAISIAAEIVAAREQRSGTALSHGSTPIHPTDSVAPSGSAWCEALAVGDT